MSLPPSLYVVLWSAPLCFGYPGWIGPDYLAYPNPTPSDDLSGSTDHGAAPDYDEQPQSRLRRQHGWSERSSPATAMLESEDAVTSSFVTVARLNRSTTTSQPVPLSLSGTIATATFLWTNWTPLHREGKRRRRRRLLTSHILKVGVVAPYSDLFAKSGGMAQAHLRLAWFSCRSAIPQVKDKVVLHPDGFLAASTGPDGRRTITNNYCIPEYHAAALEIFRTHLSAHCSHSSTRLARL